MDIEEAVWRFRANLVVILAGVVLGLAVAVAFGLEREPSYRASARLVVDVKDPKDLGDSRVIADTGQAIVGSAGRVAAALEAAGAKRDAAAFARDSVRVSSVGASAVLELTVEDRNAGVAAAVANALAGDLIRTRKELADLRLAGVLSQLDQKIAAAAAEEQLSALALQGAAGQRGVSPAAERYREAVRHRQDLEAERRRVLEEKASVPEPAIIERATVPSRAEPSGTIPNLVLGGILGLVLGVGLAAVRETLRPTVAGGRAIGRLLGVPSVGTLPAAPNVVDDASLRAVSARLQLAAEAAGVRKLALTTAGPPVDVEGFAQRLSRAIDGDERRTPRVGHDKRISWEVISAEGEGLYALRESPSSVGLVLVAPTVLKRRDLDGVVDLRQMTGWQLFGCVTYPRPAWRRRRRAWTAVRAPVHRSSSDGRNVSASAVRAAPRSEPMVSLDEPAPAPIVLDEAPAPQSTEARGFGSEALPPSAIASSPGSAEARVVDLVGSSTEEASSERAAGPEGSLHWAPWGWQ